MQFSLMKPPAAGGAVNMSRVAIILVLLGMLLLV
jgi:hypothetical protein